MVQPGSSEGNRAWLQGYDTDTGFFVQPELNDLFRQPAASRIDDATRPPAGLTPIVLTPSV